MFNCQLRNFGPVLPYKYRPCQEWVVMSKDRETTMATRIVEDGTRLARDTNQQKELGKQDAEALGIIRIGPDGTA